MRKILVKNYRYNEADRIGQGSTGQVYLGVDIRTQEKVAIKAIDMNQIDNEVVRFLLEMEKKALTAIDCQYVLKAFDVIQDSGFCYLVTEYLDAGTLQEYIVKQKTRKIDQQQAIEILKKIAIGLDAIVQQKFVHRDLKTANIMMRKNGDPVIIDFGYCENALAKRPARKYNVGSPAYMSPQAYLKSYYTVKSDIWALGIIYHEMLTSKVLDENVTMEDYFADMMRRCQVPIRKRYNFSERSMRILNSTLKLNYLERISSKDLIVLIESIYQVLAVNAKQQQNQIPLQQPARERVKSYQTAFNISNSPVKSLEILHRTSSAQHPICIKTDRPQIPANLVFLRQSQTNQSHRVNFMSNQIPGKELANKSQNSEGQNSPLRVIRKEVPQSQSHKNFVVFNSKPENQQKTLNTQIKTVRSNKNLASVRFNVKHSHNRHQRTSTDFKQINDLSFLQTERKEKASEAPNPIQQNQNQGTSASKNSLKRYNQSSFNKSGQLHNLSLMIDSSNAKLDKFRGFLHQDKSLLNVSHFMGSETNNSFVIGKSFDHSHCQLDQDFSIIQHCETAKVPGQSLNESRSQKNIQNKSKGSVLVNFFGKKAHNEQPSAKPHTLSDKFQFRSRKMDNSTAVTSSTIISSNQIHTQCKEVNQLQVHPEVHHRQKVLSQSYLHSEGPSGTQNREEVASNIGRETDLKTNIRTHSFNKKIAFNYQVGIPQNSVPEKVNRTVSSTDSIKYVFRPCQIRIMNPTNQ